MRRRNFIHFFEAKEYGSPESGNPLFPNKAKPWRFLPVIAVSVIGATIAALFAVFIYGPYLTLRSIEVAGTVTLDPQLISNALKEHFTDRTALLFPNGHRWFFDIKSSEAMLQDNFPLKTVDIQKDGTKLKVNVVEDISMVAVRSGDQVYLLNPTGKVIRVADDDEKAAVITKVDTGQVPVPKAGQRAVIHDEMPVIREKMVTEHLSEDQVFSEDIINNVIAFGDGLRSLGIRPREFVTHDAQLDWFTVTSDQEYLILFDAVQDVNKQLIILKTVLDDYFATQEIVPKYVDVRFGNRVYTR